MDVIVQGKGISYYTPDQVVLSLHFSTKEVTYDKALFNGSKNVLEFINDVLLPQEFNKEDMKSSSFTIKKETKFNERTRNYDFVGYSYNQQTTLKFDYDKEILSRFMEAISKLDNPPFYHVDFTIKDLKRCKEENLTKAYKDAEEQAKIIAEAGGKVLKSCAKVDFKPFTTEYVSRGYNSDNMFLSESLKSKTGAAETINTIFTPEDVSISETLYCLWIAE